MVVTTKFSVFVGVCTMIQFTFEELSGSVSNAASEGIPEEARVTMSLRRRGTSEGLLSDQPGDSRESGRRASRAPAPGQNHEHDRLGSERFPEIVTNDSHEPSARTEQDMDHIYYVSKIHEPTDAAGKGLWVNIEEMDKGKVHGVLSKSHRQALRLNLSFEFPYYGHVLRDITVTTGGFLYTGDVIHQMLTATQYIAPLMASFDPTICPNSTVIYWDNGTALVVQWDHVYLEGGSHLGSFTFQSILHSDGRIIFAYKEVPVDISQISSVNHPVKVGLSDAFVVLHKIQQIPEIRRRTVYEYHRIELLKSKITNFTVVEILPLPTCLLFSTCHSCVTTHIGFNCSWCRRVRRCSSGFDRYRQDWVDSGCLDEIKNQRCSQTVNVTQALSLNTTPAVSKAEGTMLSTARRVATTQPPRTTGVWASTSRAVRSPAPPTASSPTQHDTMMARVTEDTSAEPERSGEPSGGGWHAGVMVGTLLTMALMVAGVLTALYLYRHPTSSASIFFIERRPRRWPVMLFQRGSDYPAYADVEGMVCDEEGFVVMEPRESFVLSDRRESAFTTDQRDGFIVPDQKERFLNMHSH